MDMHEWTASNSDVKPRRGRGVCECEFDRLLFPIFGAAFFFLSLF